MSMTEMVAEFHAKFGTKLDPEMRETIDLRWDLLKEEVGELDAALGNAFRDANRADVADALGDILYVTIGAALVWGIDIDRVFAEIHRSNMTKTPGIERADGKILKGPNYSPPNLSFVNE